MVYNKRNSVHHCDKSDKCVLFHQTGSILSDKSRLIGFWIMNATNDNDNDDDDDDDDNNNDDNYNNNKVQQNNININRHHNDTSNLSIMLRTF